MSSRWLSQKELEDQLDQTLLVLHDLMEEKNCFPVFSFTARARDAYAAERDFDRGVVTARTISQAVEFILNDFREMGDDSWRNCKLYVVRLSPLLGVMRPSSPVEDRVVDLSTVR